MEVPLAPDAFVRQLDRVRFLLSKECTSLEVQCLLALYLLVSRLCARSVSNRSSCAPYMACAAEPESIRRNLLGSDDNRALFGFMSLFGSLQRTHHVSLDQNGIATAKLVYLRGLSSGTPS